MWGVLTAASRYAHTLLGAFDTKLDGTQWKSCKASTIVSDAPFPPWSCHPNFPPPWFYRQLPTCVDRLLLTTPLMVFLIGAMWAGVPLFHFQHLWFTTMFFSFYFHLGSWFLGFVRPSSNNPVSGHAKGAIGVLFSCQGPLFVIDAVEIILWVGMGPRPKPCM